MLRLRILLEAAAMAMVIAMVAIGCDWLESMPM
jgi:hypothetical protein